MVVEQTRGLNPQNAEGELPQDFLKPDNEPVKKGLPLFPRM